MSLKIICDQHDEDYEVFYLGIDEETGSPDWDCPICNALEILADYSACYYPERMD